MLVFFCVQCGIWLPARAAKPRMVRNGLLFREWLRFINIYVQQLASTASAL